MFWFFQCRDRLYTSESDIHIRQTLAYKNSRPTQGANIICSGKLKRRVVKGWALEMISTIITKVHNLAKWQIHPFIFKETTRSVYWGVVAFHVIHSQALWSNRSSLLLLKMCLFYFSVRSRDAARIGDRERAARQGQSAKNLAVIAIVMGFFINALSAGMAYWQVSQQQEYDPYG